MFEIIDSLIATVAVVLVLSLIVQAIQQISKQMFSLKTDYMERELLALFSTPDKKNISDWILSGIRSLMPKSVNEKDVSEQKILQSCSRAMGMFARFIPEGIQPTTMVAGNAGEHARGIVRELTQRIKGFGYKDLELLENVETEKFKKIVQSLPRYDGIKLDEASMKDMRGNAAAAKEDLAQKSNGGAKDGARTEELKTTVQREQLSDELLRVFQDIDTWFDLTKKAFQDHYERRMKLWSFALSLMVVFVLDADIVGIYKDFQTNKPARDAAVAAAPAILKAQEKGLGKDTTRGDSIIKYNIALIESLATDKSVDIYRWNTATGDTLRYEKLTENWRLSVSDFFVALWKNKIGWLGMALLVSLGAPFWYDFLKSLMGLKDKLRQK